MSFSCTSCSGKLTSKSNLTRHLRLVHSLDVQRCDLLPGDFDTYHYKCLEGCKISFKYNRELRGHLAAKHALNLVELNLDFPNLQGKKVREEDKVQESDIPDYRV